MKTIKVGSHTLKVYDSIEELPITRFHKYNKFMLIDSGIGSDLSDIDVRIDRIVKYIQSSPNDAVNELMNMRQALYLIDKEICAKHLAFIALIADIDGKPLDDLSDENLIIVSKELLVSVGWLTQLMESIKKKIHQELNVYFPNPANDRAIIQFFDNLKRRTTLVLDGIICGDSKSIEIGRIDDEMLLLSPTKIFYGPCSAEVQHDKTFEQMCLAMTQHFGINTKELTVQEFYIAKEVLEEYIKNEKLQTRRR